MSNPSSSNRERSNLLLYLGWAVALGLGVVIGGWGVPRLRNWFAAPSSAPPAPAAGSVFALGTVEPQTGLLNLGTPVPDRIGELKVSEGQEVARGDVLVVLASHRDAIQALALAQTAHTEAEAKIRQIEASGKTQIELARLQVEKTEKLDPDEIKALDDKIKLLELQVETAQANVKRMDNLSPGTVTPQEKERAVLLLRQGQTELKATINSRDRAIKGHDLSLRLARAQLQAARDAVENAKQQVPLATLAQQVAQAEARVESTLIKAPARGRVVKVFSRAGELVGGRPILQLADTSQMAVAAEVYETDVRLVAPGQPVRITSYVLDKGPPITGRVLSVGSSVAQNQVFALDPKATVDNRVIPVRIEVDHDAALGDLIGHQVKVEIQTGGP